MIRGPVPRALESSLPHADAAGERERLIAAIDRGRADLRAGRVTDDEDLARELDEELDPLG